MCGIAGMVARPGSSPDEDIVRSMAAGLRHRGPDGDGFFSGRTVCVAHTRLSIIDLDGGAQPISSADGVTVAVNGEVYNYLELRKELNPENFATNSDSEALLHLYAQRGIDGLSDARGMFGFVIVDARGPAERIILGRDPFGIKPLYYCQRPDGLYFASEIGPIRSATGQAQPLRPASIDSFLQLQFCPTSHTMFEEIERVAPGEILEVTGGEVIPRSNVAALPRRAERTKFAGLDPLESTLLDSVSVHQRSDVPYGLFLSGGIDSTILLALMARLNDRPVVAITSGFPGATSVADERSEAAHSAKAFGAEHHQTTIDAAEFWTLLPEVVMALDDPVADFAVLPTFKMAREARAMGLKVVLCGEGGDELFAGYGRYRRALFAPFWQGGRKFRATGKCQFPGLLRHPSDRWRAPIRDALDDAHRGRDLSRLQTAQFVDCAEWLPNDLLTKLDRCLMAHGVEGRTPFLDPEVARYAFPLRDRDKIRRGLGKYPLRSWLQQNFPAARPFGKKRFFSVPVAEWIGSEKATVAPLVANHPAVREQCFPDAVTALFQSDGKRHGFAQWLLLFYALWHDLHVAGRPLEPGMRVHDLLAG